MTNYSYKSRAFNMIRTTLLEMIGKWQELTKQKIMFDTGPRPNPSFLIIHSPKSLSNVTILPSQISCDF